jgi:SAM-dependent methyltransferase
LNGENSSVFKKWAAFLLSFMMAKGAVPYRGEGKFLDVGCGGGSYLYRLKQWGWKVYGVEPSATGTEQSRSLGLSVHQGQVEDAKFPAGYFDVARLNHVLEHLPDPRKTFREIHRILKTDGVVYLTLPNTESLNFWLFKENWFRDCRDPFSVGGIQLCQEREELFGREGGALAWLATTNRLAQE